MSVTTGDGRQQIAAALNLKAIVDFATGSHARAVAVLLVAALLSFLPGLFTIPPVDRDEARFTQATKQMVESGDYVDIRYQDEVRYKKPVGIYWLQAAVVKTASALGYPQALHHHLALPGSLAHRRRRRGAADLLDRARLRLPARGGARWLDDGELHPARHRAADRQDRRHAAAHRRRRHGRAGARLSAGAARAARYRRGWTIAAVFWTALAAGVLLKGPLILMIVGLTVAVAGHRRSLGRLAAGAQARWPASSGSRSWCCPGSSRSSPAPATLSSPSRWGRIC